MLVGRENERAAVAALLEAARSGAGGALVVRGVAGSGKSTLLADVVDRAEHGAEGMTVLRTAGVESESPLAFAALQRLLWPLRRRIESLPAPQRAALQSALGEAEGQGERFLTFLGTLSLLADVAEESPVLAVIDDAHWLDEASAAAFVFVARRLQAERVALLFAAREASERRFEGEGLPSLVLGGVDGEDATALLAGHTAAEIDPGVRDQLVAATGGNPLALVELAEALPPEQLAGRQPLPEHLPLTRGVEHAFLDRFGRLSEAAQRLLLVAVADDTGRVPVVRDAAARLDVDDEALDEVERSRLLLVDGNSITLYHPLVRSAVYGAATSAQRRGVHRALAAALDGDADRRAWHLAAAADRPDEEVVAALDAVAARARMRGGHEAAAAAWARAAELTTGGEERGRRLFLAASSSWLGGNPSRARALANASAAYVTEPRLRAELLTLEGQVEWNTRSLNDGYDLILQALETAAGVDEAMAQRLAMLAAALAAFGARSPRDVDPAELVATPGPDAPPRVRAASLLLRGFVALSRGDVRTAHEFFRCAFLLTDDDPVDDEIVLQPNLGIAAVLIDDDERGLRLHEQHLAAARRSGALNMVEHALTRGVHSQVATGAWSAAAAAAAEALPLAASTGHLGLTALPTAELALVAALRGQDEADQHLAEVDAIRERHAIGITDGLVTDLAHWARGLRTSGQPATALHHLEQVAGPALRRMAALDILDAAVRGGREDVARGLLDEVGAFAAGTGVPSAVAVAEHIRGVLAAGDAAEDHFRCALAAHAGSRRVPARARTELAYGEYLRRARRRVDAREHLRTALALFEELGARLWAERAAQELRASGETARRRDVSTSVQLTPQERQVATLVRQGLSNRDVAAQLFVSPRTVDFHLRNVFGKLGVTSRTELAAHGLD